MDNTKESDWIEIFTELMKLHYPDIETSEKSNFKQTFLIDEYMIQFISIML